ncbi:MAG: aminotransferase class IV [Myxococcales bacterium]|nr:aminotransferase class IV [Myxococcales bacterium]
MTHDFAPDERNQRILISIDGVLLPREEARVSVFDSGFMLGDGVWESLRVEGGVLLFFDQHMDRLEEGARALDFDIGLTRDELAMRIHDCLLGNQLTDDVHLRLMVTRGIRSTPYQDPRVVISPPTIVIIPEVKKPSPEPQVRGLRLFTVHQRRGRPDVQDPKLNSHSKLNCILACIQANKAGADEALMLDPQGFVATCNSTHFFIVRKGEVWTSSGRYCLPGITRRNVLDLAARHGIVAHEKDFSLVEVYGAEEAFVTGTFAGVTPVVEVDGRRIGSGERGPMVERLQRHYRELVAEQIAAAS